MKKEIFLEIISIAIECLCYLVLQSKAYVYGL